MDNKEYLTEERYQQSNEKVKKIGKILIIVGACLLGLGLILVLFGFLGVGSTVSKGFNEGQEAVNPASIFSGVGIFALGGFLMAPGFFLTIAGLIVRFAIGNRREIVAYTTQQVMPVAQEGIEKVTPTVGKAVGTISKEIAKGIREGINEADNKKEE